MISATVTLFHPPAQNRENPISSQLILVRPPAQNRENQISSQLVLIHPPAKYRENPISSQLVLVHPPCPESRKHDFIFSQQAATTDLDMWLKLHPALRQHTLAPKSAAWPCLSRTDLMKKGVRTTTRGIRKRSSRVITANRHTGTGRGRRSKQLLMSAAVHTLLAVVSHNNLPYPHQRRRPRIMPVTVPTLLAIVERRCRRSLHLHHLRRPPVLAPATVHTLLASARHY